MSQARAQMPSGRAPHVRRPVPVLQQLAGNGSNIAFLVGLVSLLGALADNDAVWLSAGGGLLLFGIALRDAATSGFGTWPSALVAASTGLQFGVANGFAIQSFGGPDQSKYLAYPVPEFFFTSVTVGIVGSFALWAGVRWSERIQTTSSPGQISLRVADHRVRFVLLSVFAVGELLSRSGLVRSLGTPGFLVQIAPLLAVFLWARLDDKRPTTHWLGLHAMVWLLTLDQFLYATLRLEMVSPLAFAYFGLLSRGGVRLALSKPAAPFLFIAVLAVMFFSALDTVRFSTFGVARFDAVISQRNTPDNPDYIPLSPLGRLSNISQLSQIVRLVDRNGTYDGETLEYLTYVFMPRFLWSEKPIIAKGQWFAAEIGQGRPLESGGFSNSINMTVPGELYLNFGWSAVAVGCFLVGCLFGTIFRLARNRDPSDLAAGAMRAYLMWLAATVGADLQIVVSLIAVYLVLLALGATFDTKPGAAAHVGRVRPLQAMGRRPHNVPS